MIKIGSVRTTWKVIIWHAYLCLTTPGGRGTPIQPMGGGEGTPIWLRRVPPPFLTGGTLILPDGGYPHPSWLGVPPSSSSPKMDGIPIPGQDGRGTPIPSQDGGYPRVPPCPGQVPGWGVPHPSWLQIPPSRSSPRMGGIPIPGQDGGIPGYPPVQVRSQDGGYHHLRSGWGVLHPRSGWEEGGSPNQNSTICIYLLRGRQYASCVHAGGLSFVRISSLYLGVLLEFVRTTLGHLRFCHFFVRISLANFRIILS